MAWEFFSFLSSSATLSGSFLNFFLSFFPCGLWTFRFFFRQISSLLSLRPLKPFCFFLLFCWLSFFFFFFSFLLCRLKNPSFLSFWDHRSARLALRSVVADKDVLRLVLHLGRAGWWGRRGVSRPPAIGRKVCVRAWLYIQTRTQKQRLWDTDTE